MELRNLQQGDFTIAEFRKQFQRLKAMFPNNIEQFLIWAFVARLNPELARFIKSNTENLKTLNNILRAAYLLKDQKQKKIFFNSDNNDRQTANIAKNKRFRNQNSKKTKAK
jgi:hypothetical protein